MTFLPIVARELRLAARRRGTYWVRTGAALLVLVVGAWLFLMLQSETPRTIAMVLFCVLTGSAVLYSLLSGLRSTADCLSAEKREGTLGLLFLTDLKGYDVVLGKLAATSLNAFYSVLAMVPMLAIPLLLGGITPGEFGRMALVALNTLFFSLALGLWVSAMSRSAQKAVAWTLFLLMLFTVLLPLCGAVLAEAGKTRGVHPAFIMSCAGVSFYQALDVNYRMGGNVAFWVSVAVMHGLSWLFLGLACVIAPRAWQDRPAGAQTLRWRERWRWWTYGGYAERAVFRQRLLDQNAFFWLASRARLKPVAVWALLGLLACLWIWGLAKFRRDWLNEGLYAATALVLNTVLKFWVASEAPRQLAEDRKAGTLELLLSTPLSVRDILRGQWLALQRQFLGPVMVVLFIEALFLLGSLSSLGTEGDRPAWLCGWLCVMLMLPADVLALYWVGMWQGLTARNTNRAAGAGVSRVLIFPWAIIALVMLIVVLDASLLRQSAPDFGWKSFLGLYLATCLMTDFGFAAYARQKLLTRFRLAATERFATPAGFWKRLLPGRPAAGPRPALGLQR